MRTQAIANFKVFLVFSGSSSGNSSSNVSLERDKASISPVPFKKEQYAVVREGPVNFKILEIDGKVNY